jgi:geranylgeranyl diphosphate synthase, type I
MSEPSDAFRVMTQEVRVRLDEALASWLRPKVVDAAKVSAEVGAAAECIERLSVRGGKRVRAALVGAAYVACGGPTWGDVLPAMIAIELLQTYLLIHDDWMDDDDVRRGGPSVHVALRARLGDRMLGDAGAVLAGDLASAFAQESLLETKLAPERVLAAARTFARIQEEVVIGQLSEMRAAKPIGPLPTVEEIHARKTASYTVTGPLSLGAVLAGADDTRAHAFARFGRPLGVAFQLRDDLLGVFGDPTATGKPIWNDIRQGKRTALVAEMRGHEGLARVLGKRDATHTELETVVKAMESTGARARVEARVAELLDEARAALEAMDLPNAEGKGVLRGAIAALGERSS